MPDASVSRPSVHRRGPDGPMEVGPDWETLIERQIREAAEHGRFDNLPYRGRPLPNDDNPHAGSWSLAFRILKNAGAAPPWIEADKAFRELLAKRDAILERAADGPAPSQLARRRDRAAIEALVADANAAVARVNAEAPSPGQHRRTLVTADELARYDEACRR